MLTAKQLVSYLTNQGFICEILNDNTIKVFHYGTSSLIKYIDDFGFKRWFSAVVFMDKLLLKLQS